MLAGRRKDSTDGILSWHFDAMLMVAPDTIPVPFRPALPFAFGQYDDVHR
jgi:hypothetical protein